MNRDAGEFHPDRAVCRAGAGAGELHCRSVTARTLLRPRRGWPLFLAVPVGAMVCGDGQSNWYKGVQLVTAYVIMALMFYFMPEERH